MKPVVRVRLLVAVGLVAWLLVTWLLTGLLSGSHPWLLRGGLSLIGLAAAAAILWFYRQPVVADTARTDHADIDDVIRKARRRLRESPSLPKRQISHLPLMVVLGPTGSAKTTTILQSGLDPELLAGSVHRGETVVPTEGINAWVARGSVILEAGGVLLERSPAWHRLVRHLPAARWGAALTGRSQAPRVAVVFLSCEELLQPDAAQSLTTRARLLRQRLSELAAVLKVQLPVYVVFTKLDRVPCFADYVRSLTDEEIRDVLGVMLPATPPIGADWAERIHRLLHDGLNGVFESLAARRPLVLSRERGSEHAGPAYEFPREFRKLSAPLVQFLLELGKPSQLQVAPFVRSCHFTGVRPVVAAEPAAPLSPAAASVPPTPLDATQVFGGGLIPREPSSPQPTRGGRRIPQWVFVEPLFSRVLLADRVAMGLTQRGHGVNLARRTLLAGVTGAALILAVGLGMSALQNRRLIERAERAIQGVAALEPAPGGGVLSLATLERLDSLRTVTATLSEQVHGSRPLRYRWGLSRARALYPVARYRYFDVFQSLLFQETRDALRRGLLGLPEAVENVDYPRTYNRLKAYLIVVRDSQYSSAEFLGDVLTDVWNEGRGSADTAQVELVRRQFAFLGGELPWGNPYDAVEYQSAVDRARLVLNRFTGLEPIYSAMVGQAGRIRPVSFSQEVPGAAGLVNVTRGVPGVYTKAGWEFMQGAFADIDQFYTLEPWVLGDRPRALPDRTQLLAELRSRYRADYVRAWRDFLASASVVPYSSVPDAAGKLNRLARNPSPLLELFRLIAEHTSVDSLLASSFQAVHQLAQPSREVPLVNENNEPYITALAELGNALDQVAKSPDDEKANAAGPVQATRSAAQSAAQRITQRVTPDTLRVLKSVQGLLDQPLRVDGLLENLGSTPANNAGRRACNIVNPVLLKFPFNPGSSVEATLDDMVAAFSEGGAIWSLAQGPLGGAVKRQGRTAPEQPGASVVLTASAKEFFRRSAQVTHAFFRDSPEEPRFRFTLVPKVSGPVTMVEIRLGGQTRTTTPTQRATLPFDWTGQTRDMQVTVQLEGRRQPLRWEGLWAIFEFFYQADRWQQEGNKWLVDVRHPQWGSNPVTFELTFDSPDPILRKEFFAGIRCPPLFVR